MKTSNFAIIGHADTVYQASSLRTLMGGAAQQPNGSFRFERWFGSRYEAKEWMRDRLKFLWTGDAITEDEYWEQKNALDNGGEAIRYDAAYCRIEEFPIEYINIGDDDNY